MATYYKYADRDASSQVNWAEITTNMVDSLSEAEAIREAKRKAIDDATAELGTTLSEAPQGDHRGLNEFAMTYANNAQEMRLMQDKLLKSGQLKLRDYNIGRANLTEGTSQLFNLGKKYQKAYGERMKNFESGDNSLLDADMMSRLEGFANFSNHEAYINPTNGQVSVGKLIDKEIDGKTVRTMDRTPGSFTTVQQLNFSLSQEIKKYQLDGLDAEVGKFAKVYVETFGPNFSIDDVRQMPEYKKMLDDMIKAQVQVPNGVGSILKDYVGGYSTVFNEKDQDEKSILMIEDPQQPGSGKMVMDVTSDMGKKQQKEAEEFLRRHIEKQLGRRETKTQPREASASTKSTIKTEEQQGNVVDLWNSLYTEKDPAKRNSIVSSILSSQHNKNQKNTLTGIDFISKEVDGVTKDFVEARYANSAANRVGDNAIPLSSDYVGWAASGIEFTGVEDKARREKGLTKDSVFGGGKDSSYSGVSANMGGGQSNGQKTRQQVRSMIGKNTFENMSDNDVATFLQSKLGALGFTFEADSSAYNDVLVTYPGGTKPYVLPVGRQGSAEKTKNFLDFILPLISEEAADVFIESGVDISGGVIGGSETTPTKESQTGGKARGTKTTTS